MATIPAISADDIHARVGAQSFQRGRQYFQCGAIFAPRRQDATLKARCRGSSADSYRVGVTFDSAGIAAAECSCPVGDGGYCKHVAALLLTWLDDPAAFADAEPVDAALERRSKAELIVLVKHMLRRQPDLETLLETPLPTPGVRQRPVNPAAYRRQAADAFRHGDDGWGSERAIADELMALVEVADTFAAQGDDANAVVVYEAIAGTVIEKSDMYQDEEGELHRVISACVDGLGRCLEVEQDGAVRATIMQALFDIYHFDVELGGVGLADAVPDLMLHHATAEEQRDLAQWVREVVPEAADWSRQQYGGFLLELEAATLDDEAYLQLCFETGRTGDAVDRLLARDRVDEAVAAVADATDYQMLALADLFVAHDRGDVAERLMGERAQKTSDIRVLDWLKDRYIARGDRTAALDLARKIFRLRPALSGYQEIQALAEPLDRWESVRPSLRMFLQEAGQTRVLIEIYLYEGEIDHALEAVQPLLDGRDRYAYQNYGSAIALDVARAAAATRPRAALDIYERAVERLIALQGRENYRAACGLLTEIRAVYHGLGADGEWTAYITRLREQNRRLRALIDELAAARL